MTFSTVDAFKTLFRMNDMTSQDYINHIGGSKPLMENCNGDEKVYFVMRGIDGELPTIRSRPIVQIESNAVVFFRNAVNKRKADSALATALKRLGTELRDDGVAKALPYYGGECGDRILEEVLEEFKPLRTTITELVEWVNNLPYNDAPPCIQARLNQGNKPGDECAPYYKAKYGELGDGFSPKVLDFHAKNSVPYSCHSPILTRFCDRDECKKRRYGQFGTMVPSLSFGKLARYDAGSAAYYIWEIDGEQVRFDSEKEIISQSRFLAAVMRTLGVYPKKMNEDAWRVIVNCALKSLCVVPQSKIDKVLPDAVRNIILTLKSRFVIDTRYEYSRLVQGYIYFNPLSFRVVIEGEGLCSFITSSCKSLLIETVQSFYRALKCVGFKKAKRNVEGGVKNVWEIHLSRLIDDNKKYMEFAKSITKGTPWEDNITAYFEDCESESIEIPFDGLTETDRRAIRDKAVEYINTSKED